MLDLMKTNLLTITYQIEVYEIKHGGLGCKKEPLNIPGVADIQHILGKVSFLP